MLLLILGLFLFISLHLIPTAGATFRSKVIERHGKKKYAAAFALTALISLTIIVVGWRSSDPGFLYTPADWGYHITPLLTLFAFILFISSNAPTNIKRFIRHPQMTGIFFWGLGHLFANGETRSVLLFGGFCLWAILSMISANKRDGTWVKADKQPIAKDIVTLTIAVGLYAGFIAIHEWLIGVNPFPA
ncbi:NnrU family protein [Kordiimonas sp. SCSIO 12610]|uniref:NnrU family protein n=1 Tax=Kordiimonas sp. SCSIO 12610 TaxID=2829597 RepID=UPI00210BB7E3|nr:NnrU family protein [Kordiimonas sp. SCSIO 12610]UTW54555.1 NnrU family protein [Kordiimonas sp. SCSIO 12610]